MDKNTKVLADWLNMFTKLNVLFLLVVICQKMLSNSGVSLSQTKKAINQRKKRVIDKQKKCHDVFVRDYISTKYKAIYAECNAAFNELLHAYPNKLDLTKTYRYLKWKRTIENGPSETAESVPIGIQDVQSSETVESVPIGIQDVQSSETVESVPIGIQDVQSSETVESVPIGIQDVQSSETVESVPIGIQDVQSSETTESVPTGIQDVEFANPEEATLDEMERAVNNIIREFEQDDQIMKYLSEFEQNELDEFFW